jgi:hypothetical protein
VPRQMTRRGNEGAAPPRRLGFVAPAAKQILAAPGALNQGPAVGIGVAAPKQSSNRFSQGLAHQQPHIKTTPNPLAPFVKIGESLGLIGR